MKKKKNIFLDRTLALLIAFGGLFKLIKTERSIQVQVLFFLAFVGFGFWINLNAQEWIFQTMVWTILLVAESLNTGIEKLCDFVQPDYHKKIGFIKDISAGSSAFAGLLLLITLAIIYIPKLI